MVRNSKMFCIEESAQITNDGKSDVDTVELLKEKKPRDSLETRNPQIWSSVRSVARYGAGA